MDLYDPVARIANGPGWEHRMLMGLPSRQRQARLRREHALLGRPVASRPAAYRRRIASFIGELRFYLGLGLEQT